MEEKFVKTCVGAIVEKKIGTERYILVQTRQKEDGGTTNGMIEIPAGKVREYENIFQALRREMREETGLQITKINGEENTVSTVVGSDVIISFEPYCTTQNLSGAYSIIVHVFRCEAEGELLEESDETQGIHWENVKTIRERLVQNPESIFLMHINALAKYFADLDAGLL